ncbi:MAG: diguanylate cyclase [Gammaproteobacteria bacterium]|nr:diguanylate cyclase [Gammaproteobacteria bacterium]
MKRKALKTSQITPQSTKLWLVVGFSLIFTVLLIIASIGLRSISILSDKLTYIINDTNIRSQHGYAMRNAARMRIQTLHQMARTDDPFQRDEQFVDLRQKGADFLIARQNIVALGLDQESQKLIDLQREISTIAGPLQYQVIDLLNEEKKDEAVNVLFDQAIPAQNSAIEIIDKFIELQQQQNRNALEQTSEEFDKSFQIIISFIIIGLVITFIVSGIVLRHTNFAFQALYDSELREKIIRENIVDAIVTFNTNGIIESCNKAIKDIFGYWPDEIIGKNIVNLFSDNENIFINDELSAEQFTNTINSTRQITSHHKNGSVKTLHTGISKVIIDNKPVYIAIMSDITDEVKAEESLRELNEQLESRVAERTQELQIANEKLKYLASHDTVTKLPNRALLNEHLNHILAGAKRLNHKVALLFLDIDGFKQVNDAYGHEIGDFLLREIGNRLTIMLRESDLVARVGGDEFIVVLDDVSALESLESIAHKIIDTMGKPFNIDNNICQIGVSIGISIYPQDGTDINTLIRCADQAMYKIKGTGKNNLYFYKNIKKPR